MALAKQPKHTTTGKMPVRTEPQKINSRRRKNAKILKEQIQELTKQKEEAEEDAKRAITLPGGMAPSPTPAPAGHGNTEETTTATEARDTELVRVGKGLAEIITGLASLIRK